MSYIKVFNSDFSENFKQNFIIVMARLLYPHICDIIGDSTCRLNRVVKLNLNRLQFP